jgi:hypothetical protein
MTYKSYILPLGDEAIAFMAGEKLITAGHAIIEQKVNQFYFSQHIYKIDSYIYFRYDDKENQERDGSEIDLAVYESKSERSPLELSAELLNTGQRVECHTLIHKNNSFEYVIVPGVVDQFEENFFSCKMDNAILKEGNSGSPLLIGNKVVGILHGGEPGTNMCVFMRVMPFMLDLK